MTYARTHVCTDRLHRRLMTSAAVAASLTAMALSPHARAQGVAGTGVVNSGTASITAPNASTTQVNTSSTQTVITWSPTDTAPTGGPINFLPAGNTLTFIGTAPGYTVLNRFLTSGLPINRQIALNGTVQSFQNVVGANVAGGNIWFYNAGGILIGSTGVINVGSLVLTANDIDTTGGLFGVGNEIRFRGASGSTSTVQIDAGASITVANTNPGSAYFAMVAPRVVQRGVVSTDGSTAYVAAEQADIRINQGLFDINVLVGAEGGTVIDHSGTTTGPSANDGDPNDNRIYMVAIPKNDAVTMLVSGQVGYQDPVTAQVDPNGAIRLSAGYDIFNGEIAASPNPVGTGNANIGVQDIIFNSDIIARASNDFVGAPVNTIYNGPPIFVPPPQQGRIRFNGTALLQGDNSARLSIGNQQQILATRGLTLRSGGTSGQPGVAELLLTYNPAAPGARPAMSVTGGALVVDAARGALDSSGAATGGTARVSVDGGILVATDTLINANGIGEFAGVSTGGSGTGGTAELIVTGAGAQLQTVTLAVNAAGQGGGDRFNVNANATEVADTGGTGIGGTATVTVSNAAALTVLQAFAINASGAGGTGSTNAATGTGGTARLTITGAASTVNTPGVAVNASGTGGGPVTIGPATQSNVGRGGDAIGGIAEILSSGIANLGVVSVDAGTSAGSANSGANTGGNALGGTANVLVTGGTMTLSQLTLDASGIASGGRTGQPTADISGAAIGGDINVTASVGTITVNGPVNADAQANTNAGSADITLSRTGGSVTIRALAGGSVTATGALTADASGGFDSSSGTSNASSQDAQGGVITLEGDNGTVSFASLDLNADGLTANSSASNGAGTGGTITLTAANNGVVQTTAPSAFNSLSAIGFGGSGPIGGQGIGGSVSLFANSGRTTLTGFSFIDVGGTSGTSDSATPAAPGQGGNILIRTDGTSTSQIQLGDLFAFATGQSGEITEGGISSGGESAGDGTGGSILFQAFGGTITGNDIRLEAEGIGGSSDGGGGTGTGGVVEFTLIDGDVTLNSLNLNATGTGGLGSVNNVSGEGIGGTAFINISGGSASIGTLTAGASALGGQGSNGFTETEPSGGGTTVTAAGTGGDASGGDVQFTMSGGTVQVGTINLDANGTGGEGGDFTTFEEDIGDTGRGGNGTGGTIDLNISGGDLQFGTLTLDATANGGDGGDLSFFSYGATTGTSRGGAGGEAQGGTVTLNLAAAFTGAGSVSLDVSAIGGDGEGGYNDASGDGGNATGGAVFITALGDFNSIDGMNIDASAQGGEGGNGEIGGSLLTTQTSQGGRGGDAVGGQMTFETFGAGTLLNVDNPNIFADGQGGEGGNAAGSIPVAGAEGGNGTGGAVSFIARDGSTLNLTAPQGISAIGRGGEGGTGSFGADGTSFENPAAAGADGANGVAAGEAGGNGGTGVNGADGGRGGNGGDGGSGGDGIGGTINLIAQSGGFLTTDVNNFSVLGFGGRGGLGGEGGFGGTGQAGGNGGNGGAGAPGGVGGNGGNGGRGGNGGQGGDGGMAGIGGQGTGGNIVVSAENGSISMSDVIFNANGAAGENGDGGEGGRPGGFGEGGSGGFGGASSVTPGIDGVAGPNGLGGAFGFEGPFQFGLERGQGGSILIETAGETALISAGDVSLQASAFDSFGDPFGAGGSIRFDLRAPGAEGPAVTLNSLLAQSFGSDTNSSLLGIDFAFGSAGIEILDSMQLGATDAIRVAGVGPGRLDVGGFADIFSETNVEIAMVGDATMAVDDTLFITAANSISFSHDGRPDGTATVSSTGDMTLSTFGNSFDTDTISSDVSANVQAGGNLTVSTSPIGEVDFETLNAAGGDLTVDSGLITLRSGNASGSIFLTGGGVNAIGGLTAGTDVIVNASGGVLTNFVDAGSNISLTGSDINAVGPMSAGNDILINAGQAASIEAATAGDDIIIDSQSLVAGNLDTTGNGTDNEEDGSSIRINVAALATVNNANAADDLVIDAGRVASGGLLTASGSIDITAADTILLNDVTASGDFELTGSQIGFGELFAGGDVSLQTVLGTASPAGPPVGNGDIIGTGQLEASGTVTVTALRDVTLPDVLAGLDATITAGRNMIVARAETSGDLTLTALNGSVTSSLLESTDASISVTSASMTLGTVDASDAITLTSGTGGPISTGALLSGGDLTVDGGANVTISRFAVGGDADISAAGVVLVNQGVQNPLANTVAGDLAIAGTVIALERSLVTGNANLDAVTDLTGQVEVGGTTTLDADSGSINMNLSSVGDVTARANEIFLRTLSNRPMTIAQLSTDVGGATVEGSGNLTIRQADLVGSSSFSSSDGNLSVSNTTVSAGNLNIDGQNNVQLGRITVSGSLNIDADDLLSVGDRLTAADIRAESGDIDLSDSEAQVGVLGTTNSVFVANNNPNVQTFIGGTGTRTGWHLDATEVTRLFGNDITIRGIRQQVQQPASIGSTRDPDVVIDDFTINAPQQFGANGTFRVDTNGKLRVLGDVRFSSTGDGQNVELRGQDALEVIMGTGSIYLDSPTAGQLGGTLTLRSDDIVIATAQAITAISTLNDLAAIDARLAQNDGITSDIGALAANRIILNHDEDDSVYIQNSGNGTDFDQRRGISFGAGGLFVNGPRPSDSLVINAVQRTSTGVVTGLAVIPLVTINGPLTSPTAGPTAAVQTGFNPLSTINGCPLGNIASCSPTPPPPSNEPESLFPIQDITEEDDDGREGMGEEGTGDQSVISPLITLRGLDPLTGEPLIDDPVTGAGNEDLWVPDE